MRSRSLITSLSLATSLVCAAGATAQVNEPNAARLSMLVWNGSSWSSSASSIYVPGATVQWRVMLSYTGTNTNVFALGSVTYQPIFIGADNTNNLGGVDAIGPWRNGGQQGSAIANSMLTAADGQNGNALPSYGRVVFGGTAMQSSSFNTLTTFRHGGDSPQAGAPPGSYLRVAGSSVTNWPAPTLDASGATVDSINAINRGVLSNQQSQTNPVTGLVNTYHVAGTQSLVLFRGAYTFSGLQADRFTGGTFTIAPGSQARAGGVGSSDDTRFITWQSNNFDFGSWRTGFTIEGASYFVPGPGTIAALAAASVIAMRRRR